MNFGCLNYNNKNIRLYLYIKHKLINTYKYMEYFVKYYRIYVSI